MVVAIMLCFYGVEVKKDGCRERRREAGGERKEKGPTNVLRVNPETHSVKANK